MKEFQNIPGSSVYIAVENLLIEELKQLWKTRHDIHVKGPLHVYHEKKPVIFKRTIRFLPFFKKTAIIIFPPYNSTDVNILDKKSRQFGTRLRDQLGLFWEIGEKYTFPASIEEAEKQYYINLLTEGLVSGEPSPITAEGWWSYYTNKFYRDEKAFAEAIN